MFNFAYVLKAARVMLMHPSVGKISVSYGAVLLFCSWCFLMLFIFYSVCFIVSDRMPLCMGSFAGRISAGQNSTQPV